MYIAKYDEGNINNHDERRRRKLLLHKQEITRMANDLKIQGYTYVPLKLYFKKGLAKIIFGLAKGKKLYDKRETIKKRDLEREMKK